MEDPTAGAREKVAARLVRAEKAILCSALEQVKRLPCLPEPGDGAHCMVNAVHLS